MTSDNSSAVQVDENGNSVDSAITTVGKHYVAMFSRSNSNSAEIFVFGTLAFTSDSYIEQYSLNDANVDFFRSCVRELTDNTTAAQLNIDTKNVDNFSIDSTKATASTATLMLIIFMIVIPVILIALAVIVYMKRKNL
jgi:hypothetical protein